MNQTPLADIRVHFANLDDPRMDRTRLHELIDILVIAICAVICGADDWVDVEAFGKAKETWLRTFLELPNGIPSHDTFNRVFARLDPDEFESSFLGWVQAVVGLSQGEVVAVDGKQLRRSHDQALGKSPIWMVSAWAAGNRLVLGQVKVAEKSNEITAIPKLLEVLELHGCLVTTDAMGTQTEIATAIVDREADYLLALKKNQGHLYADVAATFAEAEAAEFEHVPCDTCRTVNKGHTCQMHPGAGGRLETRECWLINRADYLNALGDRARWPHLNGIAMIRAERKVGEAEAETTTRYFITSLKDNAQRVLEGVRSHWAIENDLHWSLDVTFHEDLCRVRKQAGPENFAVLRHIALNLLKQEKSAKIGIKGKRLKSGWDEAYLLKVLAI